MKIPKAYKKTPEGLYLKTGIGVIAGLVILSAVFATLLIRESRSNGDARKILQETNKSLVLLQDSLARLDMQKALVHLADARNQIAPLLPASPAEPPVEKAAESKIPPIRTDRAVDESKTKTEPPQTIAMPAPTPAVKPVDFKMPAGETPFSFVSAISGEYMLICEKQNKLLHLFKFQDDQFVLVKSYPCIIGANGSDKKKAGDFATPKGSYFTLRYIPKADLAEIYGEGAFVLNYPNFLDRKNNKRGDGIWIHGHASGKVIGAGDLLNTKGCIAVSNDAIRELRGLIRPNGAHISIVDEITFAKEANRKESVQEVRGFMDSWRKGWESGDLGKYLSHYSKDFINNEGMNFEAFKKYKERVNRGKKFIRVQVDQTAIFFLQETEGPVAVVRFVQKYRSNNFNSDSGKLFYLKKERGGWTIFGESAF